MFQSHTRQHLLYGSHQSLCALLLLWLDRLGRHSEDCVNIFAGKCRAIDVGAGSRSREESGQLFLAEIAARPFLADATLGPVAHLVSLAPGDDEGNGGAVCIQLWQPPAFYVLQCLSASEVEAQHDNVGAGVRERAQCFVGR